MYPIVTIANQVENLIMQRQKNDHQVKWTSPSSSQAWNYDDEQHTQTTIKKLPTKSTKTMQSNPTICNQSFHVFFFVQLKALNSCHGQKIGLTFHGLWGNRMQTTWGENTNKLESCSLCFQNEHIWCKKM